MHYWADLQSVHGFRRYGNIRAKCEMSARTLVAYSLYGWLLILLARMRCIEEAELATKSEQDMKLLQRAISELQIELRSETKRAREGQYTKVGANECDSCNHRSLFNACRKTHSNSVVSLIRDV